MHPALRTWPALGRCCQDMVCCKYAKIMPQVGEEWETRPGTVSLREGLMTRGNLMSKMPPKSWWKHGIWQEDSPLTLVSHMTQKQISKAEFLISHCWTSCVGKPVTFKHRDHVFFSVSPPGTNTHFLIDWMDELETFQKWTCSQKYVPRV